MIVLLKKKQLDYKTNEIKDRISILENVFLKIILKSVHQNMK